MNERRALLLPFRWKALFSFLGFSGVVTVVTLLVGGGAAWQRFDSMQKQLADIQRLSREVSEVRGRIAELTTSMNEVREREGLPPLVHQSILDGGDAGNQRNPYRRESLQIVMPIEPRKMGRHDD